MLLGLEMRGATLGIFGYGRIGRAVAQRAEAFGMRVLFTSRNSLRSSTCRRCLGGALLTN